MATEREPAPPAPAPKKGGIVDRAGALNREMAELGFKFKGAVTRPVLAQEDFVPFYVRFESLARESEVVGKGRGGKEQMRPARVCDVHDLGVNEPALLIMNVVLESELNRAFPVHDKDGVIVGDGRGYIDHCFAIIRAPHPDYSPTDKRYKLYKIVEIEPTQDYLKKKPDGAVIDATTGEAVDRAKAARSR